MAEAVRAKSRVLKSPMEKLPEEIARFPQRRYLFFLSLLPTFFFLFFFFFAYSCFLLYCQLVKIYILRNDFSSRIQPIRLKIENLTRRCMNTWYIPLPMSGRCTVIIHDIHASRGVSGLFIQIAGVAGIGKTPCDPFYSTCPHENPLEIV